MTGSGTLLTDAVREWTRTPTPPRVVTVDRKDIQRFAVATHERDPVHHDPEAARARGYRDVVAPPLFYVTLRTGAFNLVPQDELDAEGTPRRDLPPVAFTQAMAGETSATLSRPFVAGDTVTCSRDVLDVYEKTGRSGTLLFVQLEYRYTDDRDDPFVVERFTRIFR